MKNLAFTKMHGIGNDFILVRYCDLEEKNIEITKEFITRICNRNFGIGSDGLIIVNKGVKEEFKFTIYNPDGSEAEMCGNGIRCYMKFLIDKALTMDDNLDVETKMDVLNLQITDDLVTVSMGTPKIIQELTYNAKKLGDAFMLKVEDRPFKFTPISMGNPHAVIFLKPGELSSFELEKYGKPIENNIEIFPKKTNVEFLEVLSSTEMNMRVWERGAGETLACGTGTCASVVAGIMAGYLEKDVFIKVNLLGGVLEIKWSGNKNDQVIMKGKAETTFEGVYFVKE